MGYLIRAAVDVYQNNEQHVLYLPTKAGGAVLTARKCLIALHGRNATASHPTAIKGWNAHILKLVEAGGYVVMSIDTGAQTDGPGTNDGNSYKNQWGNDAAMTAITNAKTYLLTTLGASGSTKVGFLDYSLGGGQGFNWMSRNASLCAGAITYAGGVDYDYFWNNFNQYKAELELSYTGTKTTTTGSGTLNQVGSNLTIASGTNFPASGTCVLYPFGNVVQYQANDPVIVTYTGGGGTTTLTGCTIPSGSKAWGTGSQYLGVCTVGGYATNKTTRSPILIASNVVFDAVPVHDYCGTLDEVVGASATPASTQNQDFVTAVGPNAVYHPVTGYTHGTLFNGISSDEILSIVNTFKW
jgi:hypothetical protein